MESDASPASEESASSSENGTSDTTDANTSASDGAGAVADIGQPVQIEIDPLVAYGEWSGQMLALRGQFLAQLETASPAEITAMRAEIIQWQEANPTPVIPDNYGMNTTLFSWVQAQRTAAEQAAFEALSPVQQQMAQAMQERGDYLQEIAQSPPDQQAGMYQQLRQYTAQLAEAQAAQAEQTMQAAIADGEVAAREQSRAAWITTLPKADQAAVQSADQQHQAMDALSALPAEQLSAVLRARQVQLSQQPPVVDNENLPASPPPRPVPPTDSPAPN